MDKEITYGEQAKTQISFQSQSDERVAQGANSQQTQTQYSDLNLRLEYMQITYVTLLDNIA